MILLTNYKNLPFSNPLNPTAAILTMEMHTGTGKFWHPMREIDAGKHRHIT